MNIFERASRSKLRFDSTMGLLLTEQLWDLPLTAKGDRPDLDKLARGVNRELKEIEDGSFVNVSPDPRKTDLELKLDILKHVITAKQEAVAAAAKRAEQQARMQRLTAILASKEEQELLGMTKEQIQAEIEKITA